MMVIPSLFLRSGETSRSVFGLASGIAGLYNPEGLPPTM